MKKLLRMRVYYKFIGFFIKKEGLQEDEAS